MLIPHKGHTDTIQVYSVTVMTHVKALQAGHSSQGTSEPITPELSELAHKWPPVVINHMRWRQRELEDMRKAAKVQYRKKQPAPTM